MSYHDHNYHGNDDDQNNFHIKNYFQIVKIEWFLGDRMKYFSTLYLFPRNFDVRNFLHTLSNVIKPPFSME